MSKRTLLGLAAVFLLASCATRNASRSDASTSTAASPGPIRMEAPADGRTTISGRLRAHDGAALRQAEVEVRRVGSRDPLVTRALDDEGGFRIDVPPGVYWITIGAVNHARVVRANVVTGELHVDGRLGTYARAELDDWLGVRGELLDATGRVVEPSHTLAGSVRDEVYRLDLSNKPADAVALRYQIAEPSNNHTYNGPLADRYESDGDGDFWSIVDVSGKDAIEIEGGAQCLERRGNHKAQLDGPRRAHCARERPARYPELILA